MARHSFFCIDGHTCGNPAHLVAGGAPNLSGATMIENEERARVTAWQATGSPRHRTSRTAAPV